MTNNTNNKRGRNFGGLLKDKLPKLLVRILPVLLGLGLIFHFLVVALHLSPDNPIKHQFKYQVDDYVRPFFSQNWNLFAPNPVNKNTTLLIQYDVYKDGRIIDSTGWYDLVTPLIDEKRARFWSPVQRILKNMSSISIGFTENAQAVLKQMKNEEELKGDSIASVKYFEDMMIRTNENTAILQYANYVFAHQDLTPIPRSDIDSVLVGFKIMDAEFPRFSKRKLDYYDKSNYKHTNITLIRKQRIL